MKNEQGKINNKPLRSWLTTIGGVDATANNSKAKQVNACLFPR